MCVYKITIYFKICQIREISGDKFVPVRVLSIIEKNDK